MDIATETALNVFLETLEYLEEALITDERVYKKVKQGFLNSIISKEFCTYHDLDAIESLQSLREQLAAPF